MTNGTHEDEYIDAAAAGEILGKSKRQAQRYGEGDDAPVRTRHEGRRVLYHAGDMRALAEQLREWENPPRQQRAEMVRFVDVFDYLRERDARIAQLEEELKHAHRRIGQLEGEQQTVALLRDELAALRAERDIEQPPEAPEIDSPRDVRASEGMTTEAHPVASASLHTPAPTRKHRPSPDLILRTYRSEVITAGERGAANRAAALLG